MACSCWVPVAMAGGGRCKYSCETATETQSWIHAIIDFITPYRFLTDAHVVNFFKDRLWESLDKDWVDCLRHEPVENLLLVPSGIVQEHWPVSLKEFILKIKSLVFPQEQIDLDKALPGVEIASLGTVLTQGMNLKKKHEVEILSAVVNYVAKSARSQTIVDVGSGQGYLAQVLSFQYDLSVIAIDASSHHGKVTDARAARIKKHFIAQMRKSLLGNRRLNVPRTVTCRVVSTDMLKTLSYTSLLDTDNQPHQMGEDPRLLDPNKFSFVLTGLHACGDLSVTMLKSFLECEDVKAIVSIGCCYNLLSEACLQSDSTCLQCGFPVSSAFKSTGLSLGKNSHDLACQSADRWRNLGKEAGVHNFELHAYRAAFQMVLDKHHPDISKSCPSVGRQGKNLRRQQQRRLIESRLDLADDGRCLAVNSDGNISDLALGAKTKRRDESESLDRFILFEKFCQSSLDRLLLKPLAHTEVHGSWKEVEPFMQLVGPYWSLRVALGPLLETLILLDRLLFLQEQGSSLEACMLPIFDPALSPRNLAIIAKKVE